MEDKIVAKAFEKVSESYLDKVMDKAIELKPDVIFNMATYLII